MWEWGGEKRDFGDWFEGNLFWGVPGGFLWDSGGIQPELWIITGEFRGEFQIFGGEFGIIQVGF